MIGPAPNQRIDKWLWHARAFKTRSLASAFVTAGKVRLNGTRVTKPSANVGADDVLTFALKSGVKVYKICGISDKRGPFREAVLLYEDLSPPPPKSDKNSLENLAALPAEREPGQGRPTKRERRVMDRWREKAG